ncbi:MAG TPA: hypothetical protein VJR02_05575 [Pyrinomonadaceae bacterium]|nr:hypothetical protein [Pyrinomonadaceae bacterium]
MPFGDEASRIAAKRAQREFEKLVNAVNQLIKDMADVKERLARLEKKEKATHRRQSDSGGQ